MKRVHLVAGFLLVIIFLLTGQYMDKVLGHLHGMSDGPRLLYRSRHIYILLVGLTNLCVGTYLQRAERGGPGAIQWLGTVMILAAGGLYLAAFFEEPVLQNLRTPFAPWGTYLVAAGVILHVIAGLAMRHNRAVSSSS